MLKAPAALNEIFYNNFGTSFVLNKDSEIRDVLDQAQQKLKDCDLRTSQCRDAISEHYREELVSDVFTTAFLGLGSGCVLVLTGFAVADKAYSIACLFLLMSVPLQVPAHILTGKKLINDISKLFQMKNEMASIEKEKKELESNLKKFHAFIGTINGINDDVVALIGKQMFQ